MINYNRYANEIILYRSMLLANLSDGITGAIATCHNNGLGLKSFFFFFFSFLIFSLKFHEYALDLLHNLPLDGRTLFKL